ncbi:hypothetical protein [Longirhabdus pacifica]|uniref:hypothetical protein n=1 Tax=Longirhabdus pacifica TaxID=2305227 RepID=UPI001008B2EF|nr:hypothetical protein [Longirhabdus pacifica]
MERQLLHVDQDFDKAMNDQNRVEICRYGMTVDYGGKIEKHDEEFVKINNQYYPKTSYEFIVR